jgi:hypothetical protein
MERVPVTSVSSWCTAVRYLRRGDDPGCRIRLAVLMATYLAVNATLIALAAVACLHH